MDYTEQYSEWLSAYLDGELEPTLEEPLFAALATHAELRRELSELLALRRAVRNDLVALVPPLSTTAAVFQSVGVGVGVSLGSTLLRKLWPPLIGALVGSALTWIGLSTSSSPPQPLQQRTQSTVAATPPETTVVERIIYRTRTVYQPSTLQIATSAGASKTSPARDEILPSPPTEVRPTDSHRLAPLAEIPQIHFSPEPLVVRRYALDRTIADPAAEYVALMPELPPGDIYPQFSLVARGLGTTSLVSVPQQPDRSSLFNTSALGLFYQLNDRHAVGVEIGREPFAMQFYGYREDIRLRYEAYPALLWGTAAYQFRSRLGKTLEPFVQVGIGATEFGLLGRATLGLVYRPASSLGVMVGVEGAMMRYVYQARPYWTPNLGITYGVMFRF